jgi:hypothetical protein
MLQSITGMETYWPWHSCYLPLCLPLKCGPIAILSLALFESFTEGWVRYFEKASITFTQVIKLMPVQNFWWFIMCSFGAHVYKFNVQIKRTALKNWQIIKIRYKCVRPIFEPWKLSVIVYRQQSSTCTSLLWQCWAQQRWISNIAKLAVTAEGEWHNIINLHTDWWYGRRYTI